MSLPKLPVVSEHRDALEKCVYCPKLCRASCPVSNAEPTETVTPWGKMSTTYFLAREDVPIEASYAAPAWACSGCFGCRERCDHKNDVATTLLDARAGLFEQNVAPEAAVRARNEHPERAREGARIASELSRGKKGPAMLLVGCAYLRHARPEAETAVRVAERLLDREVRLVESCCGLPLLHAGDREGFRRAADDLGREVASSHPLLVLDPGCARALSAEYPRLGVSVVEATLLVDLAERALAEMSPVDGEPTPVRYHDPCQLGRGLGRYDGPRRILERVTGAKPAEFQRAREIAECSGAGGLLPVTMADTSRAIADARLDEHRARGGGKLVTACASSLRRFRSRGADVEDLITWIARGLGLEGPPTPGAPTREAADEPRDGD